MRDKLIPYIRSGHAGLFIISHEEPRIEAEIKAVATAIGYGLFAWSVTEGTTDTANGKRRNDNDPLEAIKAISELPEKSIVMLRDSHAFLDDGNPVLVRSLKDALRHGRAHGSEQV